MAQIIIRYRNKDAMMIEEPTDTDILLGRGVRINNHPGNEAYREIIHQNAVRK